ncbi:MAG: hypothetical protein Ct9H300mP3_10130 [Gammaproteobacteria bacterium]|nr:MAG: hypothetical protein Ct9H300mP3_10130 [Gammaproteobacteria bacterium]
MKAMGFNYYSVGRKKNFFKKKSIKKILITGAGGFIGSHLTDMLNKMNYDVRALV